MGEIVYTLCALTSALCALLLIRSFKRHGTALLLWSAVCFVGLAAGNVLLFVDKIVDLEHDLSLLRAGISAVSMAILAIGLAWSSRSP